MGRTPNTFHETADWWLLRHLGGKGTAVQEETHTPAQQAATHFSQPLQGFNEQWTHAAQSASALLQLLVMTGSPACITGAVMYQLAAEACLMHLPIQQAAPC